jgi:hypothetical protein
MHPGQASCEHCGKPLAPKHTGRRPRFCSDACRKATFRALTPASRHDGQGPANGVIRCELIGSDTAIGLGRAVKAYTPVLDLCRELVAAGENPTRPLHAYRGQVLCLQIRSIGEGANLEINAGGTGFRRRRQPDAASPIAAKASGASQPRPRTKQAPETPVAHRRNGGER